MKYSSRILPQYQRRKDFLPLRAQCAAYPLSLDLTFHVPPGVPPDFHSAFHGPSRVPPAIPDFPESLERSCCERNEAISFRQRGDERIGYVFASSLEASSSNLRHRSVSDATAPPSLTFTSSFAVTLPVGQLELATNSALRDYAHLYVLILRQNVDSCCL